MLVACRLAGLSALETYYAGVGRARNAGRTRPLAIGHRAGAGVAWGRILRAAAGLSLPNNASLVARAVDPVPGVEGSRLAWRRRGGCGLSAALSERLAADVGMS